MANHTDETKNHIDNIDEKGNVLYLNRERLERKEVGFLPYKNKPTVLGINNWLLEHVIFINRKRFPIIHKLYRILIKSFRIMRKDDWKSHLFKRFIKLYPDMEHPTSTLVLPVNIDVSDKGEKTVVPFDFIKESLKSVTYIAGANVCLCRESNDCKDYPHDIGCLFLGEAGKVIVKHDLGCELTYEEACARVDKAAEAGLMGQAVWVEFEQLVWGIRNDMMDRMLEICFCCPCCCLAMNMARNSTEKERQRFHPSGWTAVAEIKKCIGCGKCINGREERNKCPMDAISIGEDGKVRINQELCVGCGICKMQCPVDAIKIKQTMPMRKDIQEYFLKDYNIDLKL